jgi:hypothetical protein
MIPLKFKVKLFLDRYHCFSKSLLSILLYTSALLLDKFYKRAALDLAMASNRIRFNASSTVFIKRNWKELKLIIGLLVSKGVDIEEAANRTIIILWPTFKGESIDKGILIISFTRTNSYFYRNVNLKELCKYFHIVLEPSWSGYMDPDVMFWGLQVNASVWVQATELKDRALIDSLGVNLLPLSIGASDWVDYYEFNNTGEDKIFDSVYVANTSAVKRIYRYLVALRNVVDNLDCDYKALLICASWGDRGKDVSSMIKKLRLEKVCELRFSLDKKELVIALNQSKFNILLSFKEGSNRSLFESMFCDLPVIVLLENIGTNKAYINEFTGMIVPDEALEDSLVYMKNNYKFYSPRNWAIDNITPEITTKKILDSISLRDPTINQYSTATLIKTNNPEVSYLGKKEFKFCEYNKKLLALFKIDTPKDLSNEVIKIKDSFYEKFGT